MAPALEPRVPGLAREGPGPDRRLAEPSPLHGRLMVVVPRAAPAEHARAQRLAVLAGHPLLETNRVTRRPDVVEVDQCGGDPGLGAGRVDAPERRVALRVVIEGAGVDGDRPKGERIRAPAARAGQVSERIEIAAHVRAVAREDPAPGTVDELLATDAQHRRLGAHVDER